MITPRKKVSGCRTLDHNSSLQKELNKKQSTATLPHSISSSSLKQFSLSQLSNASQSSCNEDDAYILLHPSGTSASTLNTGDSGFEDVRPLQRLDQEPENEGDSSESVGKLIVPLSLLHIIVKPFYKDTYYLIRTLSTCTT